ncbi:MAG: thioredoxin-dependent thiol peroxidase [Pseudomonadota bacterium]|nr:thioredoxin-dependent thiol peroxidase [Pseudomonadota bacterium]
MTTKQQSTSTPQVGDIAPDISLADDEGKDFKLSALRGQHVVLYFYPKDSTPGCTREAINFQANIATIQKLGATVIGISPDSVASHQRFKAKQQLSFALLSDPEKIVCKAYGVWVEKNMYGKKYWGVQRATFLINADGKISDVWAKVKVDGHDQQVIASLKNRQAEFYKA